MIVPSEPLKLSDEDRKTLGREIVAIVKDLEQYHQLSLLNYNNYWNWYRAKPASPTRNDPWEGASNIVIPVIRTAADAVTARYYNAITAVGKMWMGRTQNEDFEPFVAPVTEFLNYIARHELRINESLRDAIQEMVVIGKSVLQLRWVEDIRTIFVPGTNQRRKVTMRRGLILEHVAGNRILWDTNYRISEAPVVAKQSYFTYPEMLRMAAQDYWPEEAVTASRYNTILGSGSPSVQSFMAQRADLGAPVSDIPEQYRPHDVREVHLDWPFLKSLKLPSLRDINSTHDQIPIVATVHMDSGTLFRAIGKPYFTIGHTFYDMYFRKLPGHNDSPGMAELLEGMQRGITVSANQSIDAVTFANSISGVTTDARLVTERTRPNRWLLTNNIGDVQPFTTSKAIQPDMMLMQFMLAVGERVSGISDPALGREVRMGGHPAPATSTLALLQEGNKLFLMGLSEVRHAASKIGLDAAALLQQFETNADGRVTRAIGESDARTVTEWLFPQDMPMYGNLELDLAALSETMNPEAARNTALMVDQVTTNYYARVFQFLQLMQDQRVPPLTKQAAAQAIDALGLSFRRVLEMSDVDQIEKFTFDLQGAIQNAQQLILQGQQAARAAAGPGLPGGPAQLPPGGVSGPGMGPASGAPEGPPGGGEGPAGAIQ